MPTLEFLLKGVVAPLLTAFAATLVFTRLSAGRRGVAAYGLLAGQVLGLALAAWGRPDWFPDRNSAWIPWLTLGAAVVGPMVAASGLAALERWLLAGLASLAAAALIVPTWPDLWPERWISILAVTGTLTLIARGTEEVAARSPVRLAVVVMGSAAAVAAFLIAASLSLTLAQSVLVTAASLAGGLAAILIRPDAQALRGVALPYAIGIGGFCYVSAIELPPPTPVLIGLLFVPVAPLILWLVAIGPLANRTLRFRWSLGLACALIYLLAVGAWTWSSTESADDEYQLGSAARF